MLIRAVLLFLACLLSIGTAQSAYAYDNRDNASTGVATDYLRMGGQTVARIKGADEVSYLHADHLGSPVAATDAAGNVGSFDGKMIHWIIFWPASRRESYTPFGESLRDPLANTDNENFTGHIRDAQTDMIYMQARYMDPVVGRFLSNDPVGFASGGVGYFNRYAYVGNDPVNATDPDGREARVRVQGNNVQIHFQVERQANFPPSEQQRTGRSGPNPIGSAAQDRVAAEVLGSVQSTGDINVSITMNSITTSSGQVLPDAIRVVPQPGFGTSQFVDETNSALVFENANGEVLAHELMHGAGLPDGYDRSNMAPTDGLNANNIMTRSSGRQITDDQIREIIDNPDNDVFCTGSELCGG